MPDYQNDCTHCVCPRLDALEEKLEELLKYYESYERIEGRLIRHARLMAAKQDTEWISSRGIQRKYAVNRITVQQWNKKPDFPIRVQVGKGNQPDKWAAPQVEEWYGEHVRSPRVQAALRKKQKAGE